MRAVERALRRARVPVAYSQGYNPTMKLSFGPPLPLGFTSEAEYVDVILESNLMPYMIDNLKQASHEGFDIIDARSVFSKVQSLSAGLNRVVYTLPITDLTLKGDLDSQVQMLLAEPTLQIERVGKNQSKLVDIRMAIYDLQVDHDLLVMTLGIGEGGYARPTEVACLLFGGDDRAAASLPYHRKEMYRSESDGKVIAALDL